jgi:integrase
MKRARAKQGSVVLDKRIKTWNFFWWADGRRHSKAIGRLRDLPTKAAAWKAAKPLRDAVEERGGASGAPSVNELAVRYRKEKMPVRIDTRRAYEVWLSNHILPRWGRCLLSDVQARPVELWLASLTLASKSKAHIRGLLRALWDYAMWRGDVATQRNPMELVKVKGATKRTRQPRSLSVEEFRSLAARLDEPFRTIALLCVCLGLRISECLALRWSDIDWLNGSLQVERAIVCQNVDDVKTTESRKQLTIGGSLLERLKVWKQTTQFSGANDWIFASPVQLGRLPWSYDQIWRVYQKAAKAANLGRLGTHTLRHTFRTWLDSVGTPVGVQQRLMRHADIRTTMNVYGDAVTQDMAEAHGKVVDLALNGRVNGREDSVNV